MANSSAKSTSPRSAVLEKELDSGASHVLLNTACSIEEPQQIFAVSYWQDKQLATPTDSGRGRAWFIDCLPHPWVLRHCCRGGAMANLLGDRYFFSSAEHTRSFAEFRLLSYLWEQGLPVPEPVAARYERHGLFYRAQLITRRIPDVESWSASLLRNPGGSHPWQQAGQTIALFHNFGVWHADLNAHNILVGQNQQIFIIDFDKSKLKTGANTRWRRHNLKRLRRSILKLLRQTGFDGGIEDGWSQLTQSYLQHIEDH